MKLNICCGRQVLEGWTNIDVVVSPLAKRPPEILASALAIPLEDGCADEIMVIHGFEHFYKWDAAKALIEWRRLLRSGGRLILELPDIFKCCKNVVTGYTINGRSPDEFSMWGLYGDPRSEDEFMGHHWGWTPHTLRKFLQEHGFRDIIDAATQWHPTGRINRDMRIEATKP